MLIDTSGWFCSLDERDSRHSAAVSYYKSTSRRITHCYIIAELVALCDRRRFPRSRTLEFLAELFIDSTVEIIWIDEAMTKEAYDCWQTARINDGRSAMR
jgi:predicted nucleic acid-binding protein